MCQIDLEVLLDAFGQEIGQVCPVHPKHLVRVEPSEGVPSIVHTQLTWHGLQETLTEMTSAWR